jgi:hypothetical protein
MKKELLGITKNGFEVYVDMETSHAVTHFKKTPKLIEVIKEIIPTLKVEEDMVRVNRDTGVVVGTTSLVETREGDEIVYALRPLRSYYSRFVKDKKSQETTWITIDLRRKGGVYNLYTAFVGQLTPSFPGGDFLPEQSKEFWLKHALVWGSQEIVPGTETKECPW